MNQIQTWKDIKIISKKQVRTFILILPRGQIISKIW